MITKVYFLKNKSNSHVEKGQHLFLWMALSASANQSTLFHTLNLLPVSINISQQGPIIPALLARNQNLQVAKSHEAETVPWRAEDGRRVVPGRRWQWCCRGPTRGRFALPMQLLGSLGICSQQVLLSLPPPSSAAPMLAQLHHWSCNTVRGCGAAVRPCLWQRHV